MKLSSRSLAYKILNEVLGSNHFASERIDYFLQNTSLSGADRGLLTQLVYGVLREKGFLDFVFSQYCELKKTSATLQNILRLGVYQLLSLSKIPEHAALHESVALAKQIKGEQVAKFINAVLRKVQTQKKHWREQREELLRIYSVPSWLLKRWQTRYSSKQLDLLIHYFNETPPLYLRTNLHKISVEEIKQQFRRAKVQAKQIANTPIFQIQAAEGKALEEIVKAGLASIQDLSSYQVIQTLKPKPGEIGLDACAGHGGKASAIMEHLFPSPLGGEGQGEGSRLEVANAVWIHEPNTKRKKELIKNFQRLSLPQPEWMKSSDFAKKQNLIFDWILIDAPCSGLGTIGRKPEIRWRVQEQDLKKFAEQQKKIIEEWLPLLKPEGRLVYSVCSLEPEEGRELIGEFIKGHRGLQLKSEQEILPGSTPQDGFYIAVLKL